jgi:hypothetical protein
MGDLIFIIKMMVFTVIITLIMQIKVGPTTLENKAIDFTHKSQLALNLQKVAEGAIQFLADQTSKVTSNINIPFFAKKVAKEKPGQRLKSKIEEIKASLKEGWEEKTSDLKDEVEEYTEEQD